MEKIVDFSKLSIKKIRELIVFTALIVVALWKFDVVFGVIKAVWGIIFSLRSWRCDRVCDQCSDELSGEKIIWKDKRERK